uniref:Uncharacterized protein n=1 Tax=Arundo donax TaxID=35708 RepID=A0A0A9HBA7_ARUDO
MQGTSSSACWTAESKVEMSFINFSCFFILRLTSLFRVMYFL